MSTNFIEEIIEKDLASGRVSAIQTRFPPEPNGYLHLGHAKSICLNYGAAQKYGGKFFLRFDDTNPEAENEDFVRGIQNDVAWLGAKWDKLIFSSDYFDTMFEVAVRLINAGKAYVCDLSADEISKTRGTLVEAGKESPFRNRPPKENLRLFMEMRNGIFADGAKVLRAKIDMASPNINMRDPVIYRILHASHHNTGDKWCVYPMYDFAHPLEDAIEGTTHSLCTLEFEDHRPLYDWVVANSGLEGCPQQIEFARLNIENTPMSKRLLKTLVEEKFVDGWDDPRLPTLCAMRRRGIPPEAIVDFCERIGIAKSNSLLENSYFEACVRDYLNQCAPRAMAVLNPLKVVLTNVPASGEALKIECSAPAVQPPETRDVNFSNEIYIDRGDFMQVPPPKYYRLQLDGYVRLKGAYIIKCERVEVGAGGEVSCVYASVVANSKSGEDTSGVKVKGVIQWVDVKTAVRASVRLFGAVLDPNAPDDAELTQKFDKNSKIELEAYVEKALAYAKAGERFQFMREGYFAADLSTSAQTPIFNRIVSLKDNFNK